MYIKIHAEIRQTEFSVILKDRMSSVRTDVIKNILVQGFPKMLSAEESALKTLTEFNKQTE